MKTNRTIRAIWGSWKNSGPFMGRRTLMKVYVTTRGERSGGQALARMVALLCCCSMLQFPLARAADSSASQPPKHFQIVGESTFKSFFPNGKLAMETHGQFAVRKNENVFAIALVPDTGGESTEIFYDGTNTFVLNRGITVPVSSLKSYSRFVPQTEVRNGVASIATASISADATWFPRGTASIVWLAFLAESSLENSSKRLPAPFGVAVLVERKSFRFAVDWSAQTRFPQRVRFIASRALWEETTLDARKSGVPVNDFSFPDNFVAGKFEVYAWTNLSASGVTCQFPEHFQLEKYRLPEENAEQPISEQYDCLVSQIGLEAQAIAPPHIGESLLFVHDYRLRTPEFPEISAEYIVTNLSWLPTNSDTVQTAWKENVRIALSNRPIREQQPERGNSRTMIVGIFLIATVFGLPTAIALWRRKSYSTKTETTK